MSDFLKGALRGLTADAVGGPVDLMEMLANLGIAGGGYLGHKLGLLEKPPELLSGSIGGSDWFAKNTPLQDTGTGEYAGGRLTGLFAPLGAKGVSALLKDPIAQEKALELVRKYTVSPEAFAISKDGPKDLYATHQMASVPSSVRTRGKLPYDTMNLSAGVTRGDLMSNFGGGSNGSVWFVPNLEKIGPESGTAALLNRDNYSIRGSSLMATRGSDIVKDLQREKKLLDNAILSGMPPEEIAYYTKDYEDSLARVLARQALERNTARFATQGAKGTSNLEGSRSLRALTQDKGYSYGTLADSTPLGMHQLLINDSPRFPTIASYEKSPRGGDLLLPSDASLSLGNLSDDLSGDISSFLFPLKALFGSRGLDSDILPRSGEVQDPRTMQLLAGLAGRPNRGRKSNLGGGTKQTAYNPEAIPGFRKILTIEHGEPSEKTAKDLFRRFREFPSAYAEHKNFGPIGLNSDNFRGIIANENISDFDLLRGAAKSRGLPLETLPKGATRDDRIGAYDDIMSYEKGSKVYQPKARPAPDPSVTEQSLNPDLLQALFGQVQKNKIDDASFMDSKFKPFAGIESWDYIDDSMLTDIYKLAEAEKNPWLPSMLDKYKEISLTSDWGNPAWHLEHDSLLDAIKSEITNEINKPAKFSSALPPLKTLDFSGKTLAELKAMDVSGATKTQLADYDAALASQLNNPTPPKKFSMADHPPISQKGIENMIGMASGDIPWQGFKADDWSTPGNWKAEFPGLTEEQANKLSDISFAKYMKDKYGKQNGTAAGYEKDIDKAMAALMEAFK